MCRNGFAMIFVCAGIFVGCATSRAVADDSDYELGRRAYVIEDYATARKHWTRAVEQGIPFAFNNLGYLLYYGLGGPADPHGAVDLWRKGAAAGVSEAQWHLGNAHEEGKGAPKNDIEAYAWYRCAVINAEMSAKSDSTEAEIAKLAQGSLSALTQRLSRDQVVESEALTTKFLESCVRKQDD